MLLRKRKAREQTAASTLDLYYASDVHGSDAVLAQVPRRRPVLRRRRPDHGRRPHRQGDRADHPPTAASFTAPLPRRGASGSGRRSSRSCEAAIRFNGMYPWPASAEEVAAGRVGCRRRSELFEQVMLEELRRWIDAGRRAHARVRHRRLRDARERRSVELRRGARRSGTRHRRATRRVVRVGTHEMISCAYANPTPWDSPRELDEDALYTPAPGPRRPGSNRRRRRSSTCTCRHTTRASTPPTRSTRT